MATHNVVDKVTLARIADLLVERLMDKQHKDSGDHWVKFGWMQLFPKRLVLMQKNIRDRKSTRLNSSH